VLAETNIVTAPALYARLAPLAHVADHRALSVKFRALALTAEHARAAAPWGAMRCFVDLGLEREVCVDATRFINMLKNAPDAPFTATTHDNALHYRCGSRYGSLPLITETVPIPIDNGAVTPLSRSFGVGLERGAAACGISAILRRAGLEGVQLYNRDGKAYATASDSVALSSCCLGPALPMPEGQTVTLKPEAAELLAEIVQREPGEMFIGVDNASLSFRAPGIEMTINQRAPLVKNFVDTLASFTEHKIMVPLLHETAARVLSLAEELARERREARVEIGVTEGRVTFAFRGRFSSTGDSYDIVPKEPRLSIAPVRIEPRRLARVLAHANNLVFDYADRNILQLRGDHEFIFIVSGRSEVMT
jgi:hypothetical protein